MTPSPVPTPILSRPGVKRDGTVLEGDYYIDAQWCRWQRGLPRKIGGHRQIFDQTDGIARGISTFPQDNQLYVHLGSQSFLQRIIVDVNTYIASGTADRTPSGFADDPNNTWQFDQMYDAASAFTGGPTYLLAHAAPNALDIASDVSTPIYYGEVTDTAPLDPIPDIEVSGGIVSLFPFLFAFGSDGFLAQSVANQPIVFTGSGSNQFRATSKKIVRGLPIRGGAGNAPSGLFWSLDSLIRASFVGGSAIFSFDTMSNESGILSAMSVIEHDGVYYWIGNGRFMMFNGVIRQLPNMMNVNFFFDNLNWPYRNKVFAVKVPRFGEIWWCFPKGQSTEPNWAVIYNVAENSWYDTELPNGGRSAGDTAPSYRFPLMSGVEESDSQSILWQHEIGVDEVSGRPLQSKAINSFFETAEMSFILPPGGQPQDKSLGLGIIEPDFVQAGDMTVQVSGRANARAADVASETLTFVETPTRPDQQTVNFKTVRRLMRFKFGSNTVGGNYEMGSPVAHIAPADGTILGAVA